MPHKSNFESQFQLLNVALKVTILNCKRFFKLKHETLNKKNPDPEKEFNQ